MRDPRIDPQPGDIVKSKYGVTYGVLKRDGDKVYFTSFNGDEDCIVRHWNNVDDEIIHVAAEQQPKTEPKTDGWIKLDGNSIHLHTSGLWFRVDGVYETVKLEEAKRDALARGLVGEHKLVLRLEVKS